MVSLILHGLNLTWCKIIYCISRGRNSQQFRRTRMHSSRMSTAHSSSRLLGRGVCLSACWDTPWVWAWRPPLRCGPGDPPGVGLETPQVWPGDPPGCGPGYPPLGVSLETPLGVGLETPPIPDPSTSHLGVGLETPQARPLNFPPPMGVGLETCNACWDTTTPPRPCEQNHRPL